jgi:hypothetical protein
MLTPRQSHFQDQQQNPEFSIFRGFYNIPGIKGYPEKTPEMVYETDFRVPVLFFFKDYYSVIYSVIF